MKRRPFATYKQYKAWKHSRRHLPKVNKGKKQEGHPVQCRGAGRVADSV